MPILEFVTPDGTIQITTAYRCMVCGAEIENYLLARPHVDANAGHYFVSIFS